MMAYRASVQESTKLTPNKLMLNRDALLLIDIMIGDSETPNYMCPIECVDDDDDIKV